MIPMYYPTMRSTIQETTGRLDRLISEMKIHAKRIASGHIGYDEADRQTLKHHAEDMIAMGQYVLSNIDGGA